MGKKLPSPNIPLSDSEQLQIVNICRQFKQSAVSHAKTKKDTMQTCYAYAKGRFVGNDLLPLPATKGAEKDNNKYRPQIFMPITRQQIKTIFSYLKLTLFPNDEDYFRVRAKRAEFVQFEEPLTEGLKYKFKEGLISEKLGACLLNAIWAGCFAALPTVKDDTVWEWQVLPEQIDPITGESLPAQYQALPVDLPPKADLEPLNPINFYIDPVAKDPDKAKWVYKTYKKSQEIKDSYLYFNKDKLESLESKAYDEHRPAEGLGLSGFNDLVSTFEDTEGNVLYDLYYFPYLKTDTQEYRNIMVGIVEDQLVVRFHPNMFPKGMSPVVFCGWMYDSDNPYSQGPVEDIKDIQKLVNILYNYMLETAARTGNRFAISPEADVNDIFGVAGGFIVTPNPSGDVVPLHGDFSELGVLQNMIGVAKAEAQITTGSQNPFQGSANVDFQKTATELQILQENSISVQREIVEHLAACGVQPILERLMYLCADLQYEPIKIPVEDNIQGRRFIEVDFGIVKSGEFVIELVGANPSQSKQAQVQSLSELLKLFSAGPELVFLAEPVIEKILQLQGLKDIRELINTLQERYQQMTQTQVQNEAIRSQANLGLGA